MLTLLITAMVFGLVFNATPGPVFAETIRQGVRGGFRSAFAVQLGSLTGDALWAIVGLVGVGFLSRVEALRTPIGVAGAAYLLWLAWNAWQSSRSEVSASWGPETTRRRALRSGMLLSLTNPQNIAYWAAIGSALRAIGVAEPTFADNLAFFAAFMMSSMVWAFFVAALVDRVFRRVGLAWARMTYRACAIALLVLALTMLRQLWISRHELAIQTAPRQAVTVRRIA
jgi:chemosensory pili system protein ChpE/L-lysine exporter family protein LysE/ArgO